MSPPPPLRALLDHWRQLGPDERAVLAEVARRLVAGQRLYGQLDLARDRRDWTAEAGEELADAAVYLAIRALQRRRGAR